MLLAVPVGISPSAQLWREKEEHVFIHCSQDAVYLAYSRGESSPF